MLFWQPFLKVLLWNILGKNETTFIINGRVDTGICGSGTLSIKDINNSNFTYISGTHRQLLQQYKRDLEYLMEEHSWPPPLVKNGKKESSCQFSTPLRPLSAFISHKASPIGFPFMSVILDDKDTDAPLNATQMIANLYANIATQARYRNVDTPLAAVGIVSNGYRYLFVVMQLNTLDLSYKQTPNEPHNIVWLHEEELFPENVFTPNRVLNPRAIELLRNVFKMAYIKSCHAEIEQFT